MRDGNFCVIGEKAWNRKWLGSLDDAVRHARDILTNATPIRDRYGKPIPTVTELYVVEVRLVVRIALPPIEELGPTYGLRGRVAPHD